jgi:hypothetical protein
MTPIERIRGTDNEHAALQAGPCLEVPNAPPSQPSQLQAPTLSHLPRESIAKQEFQRRCRKSMHAEHADDSEVNGLSGQVIGCATKGVKAHHKDTPVGEYSVLQSAHRDRTRGAWQMNHVALSVRFACIAFLHLR